MNSKHFIGIHGYVLVYSIASRQSFETVKLIADKILNALVSLPYQPSADWPLNLPLQTATKAPMVIVGNKSDLKPELRQVPAADGQALAKQLDCPFIEGSARTNVNVTEVFGMIIAETEKGSTDGTEPPSSGSKCLLM